MVPEEKPKLATARIWSLCAAFFGIQIGFDLQNANTSRIFQTLGAEIDSLPILWIAAPLTGLLVQPIIGHLSDRTWNRFGRRRPYFILGAMLAAAALCLMPNAPAAGALLSPLFIAAGALWIMDAALNITMEPTRALVGDMLPDSQRATGYAVQSFFIGAGAVLAGALPWALAALGVPNTAAAGEIPATVHAAYYIGAAALLIAVLWTVLSTREYPPERLDAFEAHRRAALGLQPAGEDAPVAAAAVRKSGLAWLAAGLALGGFVYAARLDPRPDWLGFLGGAVFKPEVYVLAGLLAAYGLLQVIVAASKSPPGQSGLLDIVHDLHRMPQTMRQLAVVQFFTWFGLFAMWIFGTPAVAAHHFGAIDPASAGYQEAGNWWGLLGAARNAVAAIAALAIIWALAQRVDRRLLHASCLGLGALGLLSMMMIRDPGLLWLPMVGVGVAWAAIVSIPYAILSGAAPARKMGVFMGIFNIFIVAPQLLAATLLGLILRTFFGNEPIWAFAIAAACFALAALAVLRVRDAPKEAIANG